eukprot:TRINITY_DN29408_c0_g1_i6.p2 TRINITY_DN29408_c0_g1~~TRINITY_DN29408_c0_g1_i6.p2  ORF type:complete len:327 (+),score=93.51 TRINITY_DN29408_c0_g1_i6:131-982(+)
MLPSRPAAGREARVAAAMSFIDAYEADLLARAHAAEAIGAGDAASGPGQAGGAHLPDPDPGKQDRVDELVRLLQSERISFGMVDMMVGLTSRFLGRADSVEAPDVHRTLFSPATAASRGGTLCVDEQTVTPRSSQDDAAQLEQAAAAAEREAVALRFTEAELAAERERWGEESERQNAAAAEQEREIRELRERLAGREAALREAAAEAQRHADEQQQRAERAEAAMVQQLEQAGLRFRQTRDECLGGVDLQALQDELEQSQAARQSLRDVLRKAQGAQERPAQ